MAGSLQPGSRVGPYEIEREIGRGGMGSVHLARHGTLGRRVALKVLAADLAGDARFRERFGREARLAARMNHPHVVPVYDAGVEDAGPWMAMRYVDGEDLQARLRRGPGLLEPEEAVAVVVQVARALDHAHHLGVVHRDVKPANVLLEDGEHGERALLGDFGLTKELHAHEDEDLTETGRLLGTVDYMAPEQVEADRTVDGRTDVYALTAMLVTLLSGEPPFRGTSVTKLMAHVHEPPPSLAARFGDLAPFDDVVRVGMAKAPEDRPATAGELAAMAERALQAAPPAVRRAPRPSAAPSAQSAETATMSEPPAPGPPAPRRRRWPGVLLGLALLALAGAGLRALLAPDPAPATSAIVVNAQDTDGAPRSVSCRVPRDAPHEPRPRTAAQVRANRDVGPLRELLALEPRGPDAPGMGCFVSFLATRVTGRPAVRVHQFLAANRRWDHEMLYTGGRGDVQDPREPTPSVTLAADGALVRVAQRTSDGLVWAVDHSVRGGAAFDGEAIGARRRESREYRGGPVWIFRDGDGGLPCPRRRCAVTTIEFPGTGEGWRMVYASDSPERKIVNLLTLRTTALRDGLAARKSARG